MNDQPPATDPKKVFDITPPDQTVPSASSRPIIVSNKPEQTDQMVQLPTPTLAPSPTTIAVATEPAAAAETVTSEVANLSSEPEVTYETPAPPPSSGTVIEPQEITGTKAEVITPSIYAETDSSQTLSSSEILSAAASGTPKTEPADANQQQVVVHKNPRSLGKSLFWVALIVIALVVVFDVLLDSGILSLNLPHTHFLVN